MSRLLYLLPVVLMAVLWSGPAGLLVFALGWLCGVTARAYG